MFMRIFSLGFVIGVISILGLFSMNAFAQTAGKSQTTKALVESEIDLDQAVPMEKISGKESVVNNPAEVSSSSKGKIKEINVSFDEQQVANISKSLKNSIEENRKLREDNQRIEKELGELRGQKEINVNRINALSRQRDDYKTKVEDIENISKQYSKEIEQLKADLFAKEEELKIKLSEIEKLHQEKEKAKEIGFYWPGSDDQNVEPAIKTAINKITELKEENRKLKVDSAKLLKDLELQMQSTFDGMSSNAEKAAMKMATLNKENEGLKRDSARLHYNLGNLFFERGDYSRAKIEYEKVLEILPYDAAAHYNLAFVCGEFMNDQTTALKHYQQYLLLNPKAQDISMVKEKILEAELKLKTHIDSPVDEDQSKSIKAEISEDVN